MIDVYVSEKSHGSARPRRYAFLTSEKPYSALPRNENWSFVKSGEIAELGLSAEGESKLRISGIVIETRSNRQ